jgi:poly(A) polymerase
MLSDAPSPPVLLDRSWLEARQTRRLIAALDAGGIAFRFVGGAVRDALLGRPAADVDLATPSAPDAVALALADAGLKAIPTGLAHGTLTAMVDGRPFEITTLRRDVETDGRHAVVAFTDDWREDAARRDFTMNALYADRDGAVTDYFGGVGDARAGRVRFIGDPERRILEDGLRILRFFRFHAWYGQGALDPAGLAACGALAGAIDRLSGERVRDEVLKLLRAPDPAPVWRAMIDAGVGDRAVAAAADCDALARMVGLEAKLGLAAEPLRRLAALIGPIDAALAGRLKARLKLSNIDGDYLCALAGLDGRVALGSRDRFGQALYGANPAWVLDAALLAQARRAEPAIGPLERLRDAIAAWRPPKFPLSGADLQAGGLAPGPAMGRMLAELQAWWIAADFHPDRAACLAELETRVRARNQG